MILSLGDIISLSTQFAGRTDLAASDVSRLANIALTEVCSRNYYQPKEQTSLSNVTGAGDERRIELPSDFDGVIGLKFYSTSTDPDTGDNILGTGVDLDITDTTFLDSHSSTSGLPARYAIYGDSVEIDPIPNSRGSFVMRYLAKQPTLIVSTQTPNLDEHWHQGWLWKTTSLVCLSRGNVQGADDAERRYINYMSSTVPDRQTVQLAKKGQGLWVRKA